jgi:hypothetical protein
MVQKTKRARKKSKNNKSCRRNKEEQLPIKKDEEHMHHYYSKMFFDGKTVSTESQENDGPIKRRKYTLEDIEQDIPIGAELIKKHLDRKVPLAIQYPLPKEIEFKSVLPNPADLGLMPPKLSMNHTKKHRKIRNHPDRFDGENLRLVFEEDHDEHDHINRQRRKRPRDLFELP